MRDGFSVYTEAYAAAFALRSARSVSDWADARRVLSSKSSAEPTRWSTARTPYLREVMDRMGPNDPCQRVIFMKGSRVGGTEAVTNAIGQWIEDDPCPIMVIQPSLDGARSYSAQFLEPMIDTTPELNARVAKRHSRSSRNRTLYKETPGGSLRLVGANSPKGFRQVLARLIVNDDCDGFPRSAGEEGDPVELAIMRTATFGARRKVVDVSTPTIKGDSRIEALFLASDQRRYFVPCPHCGHFDWIRWENIKYSDDERPETAQLLCVQCGSLIDEGYKTQMLAAGEWRATNPGPGKFPGYHLSGLYSPLGWFSWADCVTHWLRAKHDPSKLRPFINTVLGEPFEERPHDVKPDALIARREDYGAEVPVGVGLLTLEVDTQDDSLVYLVTGWGSGEESWDIDYGQISGDPGTREPWLELDAVRERRYRHASGRDVPIAITVVDAGGHHWDEVLAYTKPRLGRRVFAIKGDTDPTKELVGKPSLKNKLRARVFMLGVSMGKDTVYSRLRIGVPPDQPTDGPFVAHPGYIHLPKLPWCDEEYAAQFTSEVRERVFVPGRGWTRKWEPIRERNEVWDLHVYALAALKILGEPVIRSLAQRAAQLATPPPGGAAPPRGPAPAPANPRAAVVPQFIRNRMGRGFVTGRRRRY